VRGYRSATRASHCFCGELSLDCLSGSCLYMSVENSNGHSMTGELMRVMVCPPRHAGWDRPDRVAIWRELGFQHAPDFPLAQKQHDTLCGLLGKSGADVVCLPPQDALSLDAVYTHDASLPTDHGLILMNPGKRNRVAEAQAHAKFGGDLGIPILGDIRTPGTSEAGDMVWLDPQTLLIGCGYRTNQAGIFQMRALLSPKGIEVLSAPLPYGPGPAACLHLMSLMSMLDEQTVLVDLPWLAVETVELLKARGFRLIEIDYAERDSLACNVLSLGIKRLIALSENAATNEKLRAAGFDVRTFAGSELCINGSGGPTCLTRPLLRA
jgi:N-dimethylarginine dimethylaminohydrolase